MATRSTAPGTKSSSDFLSAANFNDAAGGLIGYASVTANQGSITTEVALTSLTLTLTPTASRTLELGYSIQFSSTVNSDEFTVRIYKDASLWDVCTFNVSAVNQIGTANRRVFDVGPSNASHTYLLKAARGSGSSGTFTLNASATNPAWFFIADVGPSF